MRRWLVIALVWVARRTACVWVPVALVAGLGALRSLLVFLRLRRWLHERLIRRQLATLPASHPFRCTDVRRS